MEAVQNQSDLNIVYLVSNCDGEIILSNIGMHSYFITSLAFI